LVKPPPRLALEGVKSTKPSFPLKKAVKALGVQVRTPWITKKVRQKKTGRQTGRNQKIIRPAGGGSLRK